MTIKQQGGIFGRNPTFNDVDVEGTLTVDGSAIPSPGDILISSDIGVTVQGYDVDTAKLDTSQIFTVGQTFYGQQTFTDGTGASTGGIIQLKNRDGTISGADEAFGQIEWYSSDSSNLGVFAKIDAVSNRVFDVTMLVA